MEEGEFEVMPEYRISQALRIKEEELLLERQLEEVPNESTLERKIRLNNIKSATLPRQRMQDLPYVGLERAHTASEATSVEDNSLTRKQAINFLKKKAVVESEQDNETSR
jgi:alkylated DNA repair dioxygenase AlkB